MRFPSLLFLSASLCGYGAALVSDTPQPPPVTVPSDCRMHWREAGKEPVAGGWTTCAEARRWLRGMKRTRPKVRCWYTEDREKHYSRALKAGR